MLPWRARGDSRVMPPEPAALHVFLADDSALIRDRVAAALTDAGLIVAGQAATPNACIHGILKSRPDAVVLDVRLQGGSGLQVLRAVRQTEPNMVFVVFSNNASDAYRQRYLREGASAFLEKSLDLERLAETVTLAARAARSH